MKDRVVVFLDYQNVHGWAQRAFLPHGCDRAAGHINPLKVGEYLCQRRSRESELAQVRVYRGRPNPEREPEATGANDRQAATWNTSPLVQVIRRNLRYPADWPESPASEKGIDVAIAVDLITLSMKKYMDAAILFTSDQDLLPAVETIMNESLGHVEVACWEGAYRIQIPNTSLPWCHTIDEAAYNTMRDNTNYVVPAQRGAFPAALRPNLNR